MTGLRERNRRKDENVGLVVLQAAYYKVRVMFDSLRLVWGHSVHYEKFLILTFFSK